MVALARKPAAPLVYRRKPDSLRLLGSLREQDAVLDMIERGALRILPLEAGDVPRIRFLMRKYGSRAIDLVDATLVRVAERDGFHPIFTLDDAFEVYRLGRNRPFTIAPQDGPTTGNR